MRANRFIFIVTMAIGFIYTAKGQEGSSSSTNRCKCLSRELRKMDGYDLISHKGDTQVYINDSLHLVVVYRMRKRECTKAVYGKDKLLYFYTTNPMHFEFEMTSDSILIAKTGEPESIESAAWAKSDSIEQHLLVFERRVFNVVQRDSVVLKTSIALLFNRGRVDYYYWPSGAIKEIHRIIGRKELVFFYDEEGMLVSKIRRKAEVR